MQADEHPSGMMHLLSFEIAELSGIPNDLERDLSPYAAQLPPSDALWFISLCYEAFANYRRLLTQEGSILLSRRNLDSIERIEEALETIETEMASIGSRFDAITDKLEGVGTARADLAKIPRPPRGDGREPNHTVVRLVTELAELYDAAGLPAADRHRFVSVFLSSLGEEPVSYSTICRRRNDDRWERERYNRPTAPRNVPSFELVSIDWCLPKPPWVTSSSKKGEWLVDRRRTNDEKRHSVVSILEQSPEQTNAQIAKSCDVSEPFVARVRQQHRIAGECA